MRQVIVASGTVLALAFLGSCESDKLSLCTSFEDISYRVNDTIFIDASCSENVEEYLWEPGEGLMMVGTGNSVSERFVALPLAGTLSRTVQLTVSNSKSMRSRTQVVDVIP